MAKVLNMCNRVLEKALECYEEQQFSSTILHTGSYGRISKIISLKSLKDTQVGYILQNYTYLHFVKIHFGSKKLGHCGDLLYEGGDLLGDGVNLLGDGVDRLGDSCKLLSDGGDLLGDGGDLLGDGVDLLVDGLSLFVDGVNLLCVTTAYGFASFLKTPI